MPPAQRRHDMSYSPMPSNMRPQPPYQGYYHPHMNGGQIPQYAPQYPPQWYHFQQMHHQHPAPRTFPSYPQHQVQQAHSHVPMMVPHYIPHPSPHTPVNPPLYSPRHPSTSPSRAQFTPQTHLSSSTPLQSPSSRPPSTTPSTANLQQETPPSTSSALSQPADEPPPASADPFFPPVSIDLARSRKARKNGEPPDV